MKKHGIQNDHLLAGKSADVKEWAKKAHAALPEPLCLVIVPMADEPANSVTVRLYRAYTMQEVVGQHLGAISQGLESVACQDGTGIEARTFVFEKATAKAAK